MVNHIRVNNVRQLVLELQNIKLKSGELCIYYKNFLQVHLEEVFVEKRAHIPKTNHRPYSIVKGRSG